MSVMQNKKKLKSDDAYKKVFVDEDLTPLRTRMVRKLKKDSSTKNVWIDSRIFYKQIVKEKKKTRGTHSPDNLFKVGWDKKFNELGFFASF